MKYSLITLWHKKPDGTYKRILFDRVLILKKKGLEVGGSVINEDNTMQVRIFTDKKCEISVGDMILGGYETSLTPPQDAYIIKEIKENFSTSANLRHYKVLCV